MSEITDVLAKAKPSTTRRRRQLFSLADEAAIIDRCEELGSAAVYAVLFDSELYKSSETTFRVWLSQAARRHKLRQASV